MMPINLFKNLYKYFFIKGPKHFWLVVVVLIFGIAANGQSISIETVDNASEEGPINGRFRVFTSYNLFKPNITVFYSVSGDASAGEDYSIVGMDNIILSGSVVIQPNLLSLSNEGFID